MFNAVIKDKVDEQHSDTIMQSSPKVTKGDAIDFLEMKKYKTSTGNVTNPSSRFDISGNRVIREDFASSHTVFSTVIDSRTVTFSSLERDVAKEVTVPREELANPAQHATKSISLPMTPMPFTSRLPGGRSLMKIRLEEMPPWLRDDPDIGI